MSNAATTKTVTQYGISKPNGEIVWASVDGSGRYLDIGIEGAVTGGRTYDGKRGQYAVDGRATMRAAMLAKAKEVGIPQEDFVQGHEYVKRDIITVTMEPLVMPAPTGSDANIQF